MHSFSLFFNRNEKDFDLILMQIAEIYLFHSFQLVELFFPHIEIFFCFATEKNAKFCFDFNCLNNFFLSYFLRKLNSLLFPLFAKPQRKAVNSIKRSQPDWGVEFIFSSYTAGVFSALAFLSRNDGKKKKNCSDPRDRVAQCTEQMFRER